MTEPSNKLGGRSPITSKTAGLHWSTPREMTTRSLGMRKGSSWLDSSGSIRKSMKDARGTPEMSHSLHDLPGKWKQKMRQ
ncbi:uncharacterized protein PADG_11491 [Paracoccidioides brasiliensis Pb18]|uniref:Uncharacterized protein n=1 Tax=Paracoccidioides brasiliensis (strain Pb18) TaxID=502780 RepID=A0A0A0HY70_PARBD|nr:uncharacterized protein PADG_11491 [Paracoccidioides brasiliensis Pb18]KGM92300.1 hypothetical protein PADG_11491 [Paracoccidioides brasiliensis Pb18]ODH50386.1 hypothetical protein GX48_03501 [Paracoccidioides brasiliensis]